MEGGCLLLYQWQNLDWKAKDQRAPYLSGNTQLPVPMQIWEQMTYTSSELKPNSAPERRQQEDINMADARMAKLNLRKRKLVFAILVVGK